MNMLVKVLIGTAVVATTGAIVAVVVDKKEQDKAQKKVDGATSEIAKAKAVVARNERDEKSIIGRIKKFVQKKVIKFLAWVALHMEQIEAASAVIGLGSACFSIASAVRDFKAGSDLANKIDDLEDQMYKYHHANCHNQRVIVTCEEFIMDKLEVNDDEVEKRLVEIDKEDGYSA